ncbi:MAG: chorismate-binding protein [Leuconostoc sp.]|nr:chorismate-binding protein [Leuconostoc sp.]
MRQIKTIDADTLTVISAYFRLRGEHSFLLESVPTDSEKSRYSIIALDPVHEFKTNGMLVTVDGQTSESKDPLLALQNLVVVQEQPVEELPFQGGAFGYVGFDTVACYEKLENQPKDELDMPDSHLFLYETFVIFDHRQEKIKIVVDNVYSGRQNLEHVVLAIENKLKLPVADELVPVKLHELNPKSNVTPEQFKKIVNHTKELIQEGDMFQMVPSQRFSFEFEDKPFDFYRQLRRTNPSPYMYYMDYGDYQIIGSSPESLVTVRGETVTTNPIAGTRKRGQTLTEDVAIAKELKTKVRALQRIYEMEPVKRGVYAGAIGYLSRDNQMDFAIAIRTMVVKSNKGYVQAGAGIVYDSIAENEYQETLNKAKALLRVGGDV